MLEFLEVLELFWVSKILELLFSHWFKRSLKLRENFASPSLSFSRYLYREITMTRSGHFLTKTSFFQELNILAFSGPLRTPKCIKKLWQMPFIFRGINLANLGSFHRSFDNIGQKYSCCLRYNHQRVLDHHKSEQLSHLNSQHNCWPLSLMQHIYLRNRSLWMNWTRSHYY